MRLLILGAGYSGLAIAREMRDAAAWMGGTTRSEARFGDLEAAGLSPFVFDGSVLSEALRRELSRVTHLVPSIAPDAQGDPFLRLLGDAPGQIMPHLRWVGYLSTVGVYGDQEGRWVDEETLCRPVSNRSRWRAAAEAQWLRFGEQAGIPVAVLRLSGIYGPGRNTFVKLRAGTARRLIKPGQVFNRIHVDDIAGAVRHLIAADAGGIWNVSDDEPAPPQDVVLFASALMGVEPPPEIPFETADLSPMARSFYGDLKRVSNQKLKASGYALRYPHYRAALKALWDKGDWPG